MNVACHGECGVSVDPTAPGVAQYVSGWAVNRSEGGTHGLSAPQRHDRWLCRGCLEKVRHGISFNQQVMF